MQTATATIDDLKHVRNFHNGKADMFIYTHIGDDPNRGRGIMAQDFVREMQILTDELHVQQINVHINSPGGSVLEGMGIFNALRNSKAIIHTYADGLAGSIAGIIYQAGRKRFINDFARIMVHDVQAPPETPSQAIDNFREMIVELLVNNTNRTSDDIRAIMQAETWFTANEAISAGFADQVINTNRLLTLAQNHQNDVYHIYNACNELLNSKNNQNQLKMIEITNALSLQEGADEKTVLKAVTDLQNQVKTEVEAKEAGASEIETLKTEIETLKAENATLKTEAQKTTEAAAVEYVENLVKEGKISEEKKDDVTAKAIADLDGVKNLFDAVIVKPAHADITNHINPSNNDGLPEMRLREMEKKDPAKLDKIRNEQPELYAKMYEAQYGVKL